ncbi:hypothetical protein RIF29_35061 [Crotalaria pallida]|uniref:Allantoinase n=1 Tax=Crotalaria pallida TaxID=3830 RepID=A0AAN9EC66_CROPI
MEIPNGEIPNGDTHFKYSPPIRDAFNIQKLWEAILEGHIDLLSTDHSPTIPELKLHDEGDFLRAWGGISSLQVSEFSFRKERRFSNLMKFQRIRYPRYVVLTLLNSSIYDHYKLRSQSATHVTTGKMKKA